MMWGCGGECASWDFIGRMCGPGALQWQLSLTNTRNVHGKVWFAISSLASFRFFFVFFLFIRGHDTKTKFMYPVALCWQYHSPRPAS